MQYYTDMNSYLKSFLFSMVIGSIVLTFNPSVLSLFLIPVCVVAYKYGIKQTLIPLIFLVGIGVATSGTGMNSVYRRIPLFFSATVVAAVVLYGRKLNQDVK